MILPIFCRGIRAPLFNIRRPMKLTLWISISHFLLANGDSNNCQPPRCTLILYRSIDPSTDPGLKSHWITFPSPE
jgi:hypothetical protein